MSESIKPEKHTQMIDTTGELVLRSVFPSVASKDSCVDCHNKIQAGNQVWKKGDLMGALVIDRSVSGAFAEITRLGWITGPICTFII